MYLFIYFGICFGILVWSLIFIKKFLLFSLLCLSLACLSFMLTYHYAYISLSVASL